MNVRIMCAFVVCLMACKKDKAAPATSQSEVAVLSPPRLEVRERPGLLFTYLDDKGDMVSTETLANIPSGRRAGVRVIDLSQSPDARGAGRWIFVADLRQPNADGTYPVQAVSGVNYERALTETVSQKKVETALQNASTSVTVYTTSWCGVCAKAKAFLKAQNVPFVERDVETDDGAQAELAEKAKRAGIVPSGVPVIDVYGQLMVGFDEARLREWLARRR